MFDEGGRSGEIEALEAHGRGEISRREVARGRHGR
jgi:hypothetical protein